jgi:hypothetical protein
MKKFLKENWFKLSIALTVVLVGASFFYTYLETNRERTKIG